MKITLDKDLSGKLTFRCGDHEKVIDPRNYSSGKDIKNAVLAWAKPLGGTETDGF